MPSCGPDRRTRQHVPSRDLSDSNPHHARTLRKNPDGRLPQRGGCLSLLKATWWLPRSTQAAALLEPRFHRHRHSGHRPRRAPSEADPDETRSRIGLHSALVSESAPYAERRRSARRKILRKNGARVSNSAPTQVESLSSIANWPRASSSSSSLISAMFPAGISSRMIRRVPTSIV